MECHVESNVLLVYKVTKRHHVLLRRICTHWELYTGNFGATWPSPSVEAEELKAYGLTMGAVGRELIR